MTNKENGKVNDKELEKELIDILSDAKINSDADRQEFEENDGIDGGEDGGDGEKSCGHDPDTLAALARERADFLNYRTRATKEQLRARTIGKRDTITKLLPVLEEISRAKSHEEIADDSPFGKIIAKLDQTFKDLGVVSFGAVGDEFNPTEHEALTNRPATKDDKIADGAVIIDQVVEAGYKLDDELLSPAKVITVSNG